MTTGRVAKHCFASKSSEPKRFCYALHWLIANRPNCRSFPDLAGALGRFEPSISASASLTQAKPHKAFGSTMILQLVSDEKASCRDGLNWQGTVMLRQVWNAYRGRAKIARDMQTGTRRWNLAALYCVIVAAVISGGRFGRPEFVERLGGERSAHFFGRQIVGEAGCIRGSEGRGGSLFWRAPPSGRRGRWPRSRGRRCRTPVVQWNISTLCYSTQMARSAPTRAPKGLGGGEARLDTNPLAPDNAHRKEPRQSGRCWSWPENARTPQALSWSVCRPAPLGSGTGPGPRGPETPPQGKWQEFTCRCSEVMLRRTSARLEEAVAFLVIVDLVPNPAYFVSIRRHRRQKGQAGRHKGLPRCQSRSRLRR